MSTLIVTAGNIGSGKTTLAKWIGEQYGMETYCEVVKDNRYLSDFYNSFRPFAFRLAIHFLSLRSQQLIAANTNEKGSIIDRSIYEDPEVFVRRFRDEHIIENRDYNTYIDIWDLVKVNLPEPNLLIYLHAPSDVLLQRIKRRGRDFEKKIDSKFLESLQTYYDKWFKEFKVCQTLEIDSSKLNYNSGDELIKLTATISKVINLS